MRRLVSLAARLVFISCTPAWAQPSTATRTPTFSATPAPGQVVIQEVDANPQSTGGGEAKHEWLELYNRTGSYVTLIGWTIADNNGTDAIPSFTLPPFCSAALVADPAKWDDDYPDYSGILINLPGGEVGGNGLGNLGDRLVLKNGSDATVDCMSYGTDTTCYGPLVPPDGPTQSISRDDLGTDTDSAGDWSLRNESPGQPCGAPPQTATPSGTPAATDTPPGPTPTFGSGPSPTRTFTPGASPTATEAESPGPSATRTHTRRPGAPTFTPTRTSPPSPTFTATTPPTLTRTPTITNTPTPGPARMLVLEAPAAVGVGTPFSVTVTARDFRGFTVPQYAGLIRFYARMDPGMARPEPYRFVQQDEGVHDFTDGFAATLGGTQSIEAVDAEASNISGSTSLEVDRPPVAGHYFVSKADGDDSDDGITPDSAWATLGHAAATAPADSVIHVMSSASAYEERITLARRLHLLGDSINGAVLDGMAAGSVIRVLPAATGSSIRRFTIRNGRATPAGTSAGIAVYGAAVTLSNLLLQGCRAGIQLNEAPAATIDNVTVDGSGVHALESRNSSFTLRNAVISDTGSGLGGCPVYRKLDDATADGVSFSASVEASPAGCLSVPLGAAPVYWDPALFYLDPDCLAAGCPENDLYVNGGDPGLQDVDRTPSDLGVYGGPLGEAHYPEPLLPAADAMLLGAAALLAAAMARRRIGPRRGNR